ncbi:MAG TPA: GDSL-type esterase/lipase family protein [Bryobacteraceae bacterium]|jgi:lysophospholipase L1-like esterase
MPTKTILTIAAATILIWALHFVPQLNWVSGPDVATLEGIVGIKPAPKPVENAKKETTNPPVVVKVDPKTEGPKVPDETLPPIAPTPGPVNLPDITTGPPTSIDDPTGEMRHFYEALARTQAKQPGAITRVLHYGDSPITADSITADTRAMLQAQFGDAGHGFVLIAKPWAWYMHRGVDIAASGWNIEAASQTPRARDGLHGFGGVSFVGGPGATSRITLPDALHTKVEVIYLKQKNGGDFKLMVGPETIATVSTAADGDEKSSGYASAALPENTSQVKLTVTKGTVRLFGFDFEKPGPGVVYDSLGLNGASVQHLLRYFNADEWTEQLRHENPDLVVLNYGTNESVYPKYVDTMYSGELTQVLERVHAALPKASILVMSPMDRGERTLGVIRTLPIMPRIVELQHKIAIESGCAFFDTFHAMGGEGTMARWYDNKPRLVNSDYTHPFPGGAAVIGNLLDHALVEGFEKWKGHRQ